MIVSVIENRKISLCTYEIKGDQATLTQCNDVLLVDYWLSKTTKNVSCYTRRPNEVE